MTEKTPEPLTEERLAEIEVRAIDVLNRTTSGSLKVGRYITVPVECLKIAQQDVPDLLANLRRARAQRDELLIAVRDILKATSRPGTGEIPAALSRALAAVTRV